MMQKKSQNGVVKERKKYICCLFMVVAPFVMRRLQCFRISDVWLEGLVVVVSFMSVVSKDRFGL